MTTPEKSPAWALRVEGLSKVYKIYGSPLDRLKDLLFMGARTYHEDLVALQDANFELVQGSTVGVIGRNGAGKSTLLKIISGNLEATTGTVEMRGRVSSILELGMGFQPALTGRQNVRINGLLLGLLPNEIEDAIPGVVEFSEIGDAIDRPIGTYSSGMKARLAFSILTAVNADIVILDEALATGDVGFLHKGRALIKQFKRSGATVLLVSHDMEEVSAVCNRVIWIDKGRVLADGDPKDVVQQYLEALPGLEDESNPSAHTQAPTRVLLKMTPTAPAEGAHYDVEYFDWLEDGHAEPLGRARPYLDFHFLESVRGCRENGLSRERGEQGWGEVQALGEGRRVRRFEPTADGAFMAIVSPQESHGGVIRVRVIYRDTATVPLKLELIRPGSTLGLGELFGQGDGAWRELVVDLPDDMRFDTLRPLADVAVRTPGEDVPSAEPAGVSE
ncbi:ABC transporter ATP-binding protein [Planctomycetota bacterium]|nr:ABC transporter ATP-binding protein [Planctomycetota bacterium]